jgi:flagellar biogenesis protein FliO
MLDTVDYGFQIIKVFGGLALVLALLFAVLYGIKMLPQWTRKPGTETWIQILAQRAFGPKHYLLVVKVQNQLFLLGISPQGMHLLAPLGGPPGETSTNRDGAE